LVSPTASSGASRDRSAQQFRVAFQVERVFEARDVRDAVRQAEAFGATEIVQVARLP
jgi:hypothetical protein